MPGGYDILREYASLEDPTRKLAPDVCLGADEKTVTIFDKYPKAQYHFLVLPRLPYILSNDEKINELKLRNISTLVSLKESVVLEVLYALAKAAQVAKEMIEDEMYKAHGCVWPIFIGFHAVESLPHLHLHVISSDLVSDCMKVKKHYNTFHPDLGYFVHLNDVINWVRSDSATKKIPSVSAALALTQEPLRSHHTKEPFTNMPKLKAHLERYWKNDILGK